MIKGNWKDATFIKNRALHLIIFHSIKTYNIYVYKIYIYMYLTTITINEMRHYCISISIQNIVIGHSLLNYWDWFTLFFIVLYRRNLITRILTFNYPWNVSGTFGIAHTFNHQKKFFNLFLQFESLKRGINESKYIWYWRNLRWRSVTVINITLS